MSMNSRSLPQNKVMFGSDPLAKFILFVQKCMLIIRVLSLGTESTILMRRLRWSCWHPDLLWKMVVGYRFVVVKEQPSALATHLPSPTTKQQRSWALPNWPPLSTADLCMWLLGGWSMEIARLLWVWTRR